MPVPVLTASISLIVNYTDRIANLVTVHHVLTAQSVPHHVPEPFGTASDLALLGAYVRGVVDVVQELVQDYPGSGSIPDIVAGLRVVVVERGAPLVCVTAAEREAPVVVTGNKRHGIFMHRKGNGVGCQSSCQAERRGLTEDRELDHLVQ